MKLSLDWLNNYLDKPVTADLAQHLLANQGFPIESVEPHEDDTVIDAEVTSNRSDCLGHIGMAREIAAGADVQLMPPTVELPPQADAPNVDTLTRVDNQQADLCPLYTARVIQGVKVGPSPTWLRRRLEAVGLRSVNNIVDITNYVLMETGQPLHAFDMARLDGGRIVVRAATDGEAFTAIDGSKHTLKKDMLVIADATQPVAIAGVMGGLNSEVGEKTVDILLESARFDPLTIRRTARALKLASDSSYRFERGVDPAGVQRASDRAAGLILELAGGRLAQGIIRQGAELPQRRVVSMRVARCNQILGVTLSGEEMMRLLASLHLEPRWEGQGQANITCTVPTFRLDIEREIDLVEEVARLHGLDHIEILDRIHIRARGPQPGVQASRKLRQVLVAHGYHEIVTFSFIQPKLGKPFVPEGFSALLIDDERRKAEPMLRPAVAPSLLSCRKANQDVGNAGVRLFETASTWVRQDGSILERRQLGMLADADEAQQAMRDVRGAIEELIDHLGGHLPVQFESAQQPNLDAAVTVSIGAVHIGHMGIASSATLQLFDLQTPVVLAELDLESLLELYPPVRQVGNLPRFPGIERDLSIVVDEQVTWQQVEAAVRAVNPPLMEQVTFLVIYRGKPIAAGRKSLSLRMLFRDPQRTLRHDQVDPQVAAVVERLKTDLGAELRA